MTFVYPAYLFLLLLIVPLAAWYWLKLRNGQPDLQISSVRPFTDAPRSYKYYLQHAPFILRCITIALTIIAIARPQSVNSVSDNSTEGIDIMLAIDISTSMEPDLGPNRLEAAKSVATEFIQNRPNDRIGLVLFAAESFLQCPLTTDHKTLIALLKNVQSKMLRDGTAIGFGLTTSASRLKDSGAKSKVIILLTDGANNEGISPLTAADIARTFGIRVYTVDVGNVDGSTLRTIAEQTGGFFFNAADMETLRQVYREIDTLEKSKLAAQKFEQRKDEFHTFALLALVVLLLEILLRKTVLRRIP